MQVPEIVPPETAEERKNIRLNLRISDPLGIDKMLCSLGNKVNSIIKSISDYDTFSETINQKVDLTAQSLKDGLDKKGIGYISDQIIYKNDSEIKRIIDYSHEIYKLFVKNNWNITNSYMLTDINHEYDSGDISIIEYGLSMFFLISEEIDGGKKSNTALIDVHIDDEDRSKLFVCLNINLYNSVDGELKTIESYFGDGELIINKIKEHIEYEY
ncbi:hypothetical protein [Microcystis phage Mel-JY01]